MNLFTFSKCHPQSLLDARTPPPPPPPTPVPAPIWNGNFINHLLLANGDGLNAGRLVENDNRRQGCGWSSAEWQEHTSNWHRRQLRNFVIWHRRLFFNVLAGERRHHDYWQAPTGLPLGTFLFHSSLRPSAVLDESLNSQQSPFFELEYFVRYLSFLFCRNCLFSDSFSLFLFAGRRHCVSSRFNSLRARSEARRTKPVILQRHWTLSKWTIKKGSRLVQGNLN